MNVPSITSPALRASLSFRIVTLPVLSVSSNRTVVASAMVTDFSLAAKSPRLMVATCAFESRFHGPLRQLAGLRQQVGHSLGWHQPFREVREDSPREGDVRRLDRDAAPAGEFPDDRQQRVGGQRGRFVDLGPHDLSWSARHYSVA